MAEEGSIMIIPPIRGIDVFGSGHYGASRGKRKHRGIDLACYPGSIVCSVAPGKVTKLGYPYSLDQEKKKHFRYVEVTLDGNKFRYFYILPVVKVGDDISVGTPLGISQKLGEVYKGITEHVHFEVIEPDGNYTDPERFIYP